MRLVVRPGRTVEGSLHVPGDKSIAHRWLILAATARGPSILHQVPPSLDVRATAACLAMLAPKARPGLDAWSSNASDGAEGNGFTWDAGDRDVSTLRLQVESEGRLGLATPAGALDCGNSGTSMRLLAGVLAASPFSSTLVGDESLSTRPMDRVAVPLRAMGADVRTTEGHAPLEVSGGPLRGVRWEPEVPSAQVKSAILLAGYAGHVPVTLHEPNGRSRDHTERMFRGFGLDITEQDGWIHFVPGERIPPFEMQIPGDFSSAAFLVGAAILAEGGELVLTGVGTNPSRTGLLGVLARMGSHVLVEPSVTELGEPIGSLLVRPAELRGTEIAANEIPGIIDEIPLLAVLATRATGTTIFHEAGELRVKESDRLGLLATNIRALGGHAVVEGNDLRVEGRLEPPVGRVVTGGDHRLAMAFAIAALGADRPSTILGSDAVSISYPGYFETLDRVVAA